MDKIKAIIVDDAPNARKLLRLMLAELCPNVWVAAEAENAENAAQLIAAEKPEIVFLDIEMPGKSGLQLIEDNIANGIHYQVIFTTAYNQYAIQAFRLSAIDYLLKPINEEHLTAAVEKVARQINLEQENRKLSHFIHNYKNNHLTITISQGNAHVYLQVEDVMYITADGSYTHICTAGNKIYIVSKNLKYFENVLANSTNFVRVHRKYLINVHHVEKYDKHNRGTITMKDNHEIDLARERRTLFFESLKVNG